MDHAGPNNPNWKGGISYRGKSHRRYAVLLVDGKYVPEHRLIAERLIGRKLHPKERVYYKDGDRTNNEPNNLIIVTASVYGQLTARIALPLAKMDSPRIVDN